DLDLVGGGGRSGVGTELCRGDSAESSARWSPTCSRLVIRRLRDGPPRWLGVAPGAWRHNELIWLRFLSAVPSMRTGCRGGGPGVANAHVAGGTFVNQRDDVESKPGAELAPVIAARSEPAQPASAELTAPRHVELLGQLERLLPSQFEAV